MKSKGQMLLVPEEAIWSSCLQIHSSSIHHLAPSPCLLHGPCLLFSTGWSVLLSVKLMVLSLAQGDCGVPLACRSLGPGLLFLRGCRIFWKWLWFNGSANHSWPLDSRCPTGEKLQRNLCLGLFGERPRAQGRNCITSSFRH